MAIDIDSPLARRIAAFAFLVFIFGATFWVLSPFFAALAWAGILAYVTWPLHQRLHQWLPERENLVAFLMTLGVAGTLLLPLLWVMFILLADVAAASALLRKIAAEGLPPLPPGVRELAHGETQAALGLFLWGALVVSWIDNLIRPMAIIPLQIKMVYGIGRAYGVTLDQGHIKELIAAAGVGLTSQYLEQFGRKLLGDLLGKMAGKTVGKVGGATTGMAFMAFSFATTYALGQLAKRYYAGGRQMNTAMLKDTFQNLLGPAKQLQTQYLPQIRQQASTLDMGRVLAMARS
ncbi:MAG: hypothetical protein ACYC0G_00155 [Thiobacillus sp.]|nr:MAG: hypothetical protein B7X91_01900 [Hydrogenophilales bacterium 17-64-11]